MFFKFIRRKNTNYNMRRFSTLFSLAVFMIGSFIIGPRPASAGIEVHKIIFPVLGSTRYSNDFFDPRVGHRHEGNDIFGVKGQILLAAVDGTVRVVKYPEPSYGWYMSLTDADGYEYVYVHINNDTPGTDDGNGGPNFAYIFGSNAGWPVRAGQPIAYLGDSGNAESTAAHLHFEIRSPDDTPVNPFFSLQAARKISTPKSRARRENETIPFPGTTVGLRVASGQLDPTTPDEELVVAQSSTVNPLVRVFSTPVRRFSEFSVRDVTKPGGVDVAVGDTNGDGTDEIIIGFGRGNQPFVQIVTPDGSVLSSFLAYPAGFRGGVNVAAADLDGDGRDEIITGAGPGGGPEIRVFSFAGDLSASFNAFEGTFRGGVDVDGFDATDETAGSIVTSSGPGRTTTVRIFTSAGTLVTEWDGYTSDTVNGARITAWPSDGNSADTIAIIPAQKSTSLISRFTVTGQLLDQTRAFERWWFGSFDIGVWRNQVIGATGAGRPTVVVPVSLSGYDYGWWN